MNKNPEISWAEMVLPCTQLDETMAFFIDRLGFQLESIMPADNPAVAVIRGYGLRLRLDRRGDGGPGVIRLSCNRPQAFGKSRLTAPNGTVVELTDADPPLFLPDGSNTFSLQKIEGSWHAGRAGMLYRDLIPDRQGGRFIASHIRIPTGGPPPDYTHYHKIRFQMIYCYKGFARVAYEDQGPPIRLEAGDCVLQPSQIRHKVLEFGDNSEFIEVGCPAEHETCTDPAMTLPTSDHRPERDFSGQRFVFHQADKAAWNPWRVNGFQYRDTGIEEATGGLAGARVVRVSGADLAPAQRHKQEFLFFFVLQGQTTFTSGEHGVHSLSTGDCITLPSGADYAFSQCSGDLQFLEVSLPGSL